MGVSKGDTRSFDYDSGGLPQRNVAGSRTFGKGVVAFLTKLSAAVG